MNLENQPPNPPPPGDKDAPPHVLANRASGENVASTPRRLVTVDASTVKPAKVRWVWEGLVPAGSLTLGVGVGGLGKTLALVCDLAAQVTTGRAAGDLGEPRNVVISTAEDSLAHTLVPRLLAARADLGRVRFVKLDGGTDATADGLTLPEDAGQLLEIITGLDAALTLIDPVAAHLSDKLDSHRDHGIRRALGPLSAMADESGSAVLGIAHLNKRDSGDLYERINGSSGMYNAARSVLLVTTDPDAPEDTAARVLVHGKCNVGQLGPARRFSVVERTVPSDDGPIVTAGVEWGDLAPDIDAYRALVKRSSAEGTTAMGEAVEWLRDALEDGPRPVAELKQRAEADGISTRTLERAKRKLNLERTRDGFTGPFSWSLPVLATYSPDAGLASTATTEAAGRVLELVQQCGIPSCSSRAVGREPDGTPKCAEHTTWEPTP